MHDVVESSMNFDLENVPPFLVRVSPLVESGFGEAEIWRVVKLVNELEHDDEGELLFNIRYDGQPCELRVRVFMDDIESPDMYFFSPPGLAEKISDEMERFADELDI
jgi:hypothetical protein